MLKRHIVLLTLLLPLLAPCANDRTADVPPSAAGTFLQRKILADVDVTLVSTGTFKFEKDRFFEWRTLKPMPSVFLATPTNYTISVNGRTSAHPLNVNVSSFAKIFEIKEVAEFVKDVHVSPDAGFPSRVDVRFKNGDRLEIEMTRNAQ